MARSGLGLCSLSDGPEIAVGTGGCRAESQGFAAHSAKLRQVAQQTPKRSLARREKAASPLATSAQGNEADCASTYAARRRYGAPDDTTTGLAGAVCDALCGCHGSVDCALYRMNSGFHREDHGGHQNGRKK